MDSTESQALFMTKVVESMAQNMELVVLKKDDSLSADSAAP